ncbi:MAG: YsnF/AvaK domain-containing protein [Chloroflexota bacterium]|nr:YsnF/AvaK domain-containing protein [Chloroflexota bacterium]
MRVSKDVVEEEQTLEVPVTREEVHVQSRVVDRPVTDSTTAFTEDVIEVPVREEDVQVRKEARVAEELEIEKRAVQETERVTDTVRKERVNVEESGDVDVTALAGDPYNRNITARD